MSESSTLVSRLSKKHVGSVKAMSLKDFASHHTCIAEWNISIFFIDSNATWVIKLAWISSKQFDLALVNGALN